MGIKKILAQAASLPALSPPQQNCCLLSPAGRFPSISSVWARRGAAKSATLGVLFRAAGPRSRRQPAAPESVTSEKQQQQLGAEKPGHTKPGGHRLNLKIGEFKI